MADPGPSHLTNNKKPSKAASSSSAAAVSKDKQDLDQKHTKAFDFTQRKRWADILVNELSGAIMFVLNSAGLIVFVGEAARELLNWNDTSVQGMEFAALIHPDDISPFSKAFVGSIRDHAELDIFIRLKSYHTEAAQAHTGGKWPMYEIRGHPHFGAPNPSAPFAMGTVLPQAECKGFFATARPYPTRGSAVLDSFLELKIENERLRRNLETLRIAHPDLVAAAKEDAAVATSSSSRRRSEKEPRSADDIAVDSNSAPMNPFAFDFTFPGPTTSNGGFPPGGVPSVPATGEDVNMMRRHSIAGSAAAEDTSSRKRGKRKAAGLEQRVCHTCGRTDSPEWRKGPLGPKTLCNACGLRFSKKVKTKPSDSNDKEGSPPAAVALDPGVDGEGEDDAGDLQGLDGTGIIAADALTQSPIVHAHRELDFSAARMGYDMSGMGGSAAGGPPPPLSSSKLPASHSVSGRHASFSGILPSPSSIPLPFANPSASPTTTAAHAHNSYFPVSMTMSMPSNLSAFFASSNGHGSSGRTPTYELPGYGLGNMDHSIRAPQPKQALPPLQTHFEYDGVVGLGSAAPPTSALSSGTHHVLTASSGAGYHHYQPPSGQP